VSLVNEICSRHDIAEILLKLALNTNQSINHFYNFDLRRFVFLKGDNRMVFKDFPAPVVDLMVEK
jgi:hypothetical protein